VGRVFNGLQVLLVDDCLSAPWVHSFSRLTAGSSPFGCLNARLHAGLLRVWRVFLSASLAPFLSLLSKPFPGLVHTHTWVPLPQGPGSRIKPLTSGRNSTGILPQPASALSPPFPSSYHLYVRLLSSRSSPPRLRRPVACCTLAVNHQHTHDPEDNFVGGGGDGAPWSPPPPPAFSAPPSSSCGSSREGMHALAADAAVM